MSISAWLPPSFFSIFCVQRVLQLDICASAIAATASDAALASSVAGRARDDSEVRTRGDVVSSQGLLVMRLFRAHVHMKGVHELVEVLGKRERGE